MAPNMEYILNEVKENGFCIADSKIDLESYLCFTEAVGSIVGDDNIKLNETQRKLHSPAGLPFHTDSNVADYISWFCISPGKNPHPTLLLDTKPILAQFDAQELAALRQVLMRCPNRTHDTSFPVPLLNEENKIFYTPWFPLPTESEDAVAAEKKFRALVDEAGDKAVEVTLKEGQFFMIDNKRVLHGRKDIEASSDRWLRRRWIAVGSYDDRLIS